MESLCGTLSAVMLVSQHPFSDVEIPACGHDKVN